MALIERARVYEMERIRRRRQRIAVNVSPIQLRQRYFVDFFRQVFSDYGPEIGIDIEITESMVMQDIERTQRSCVHCAMRGPRSPWTNFGTGYSSLVIWHDCRSTQLKIDRSFISNITEIRMTRRSHRRLFSMAQALGLLPLPRELKRSRNATCCARSAATRSGYLIAGRCPKKFEDAPSQLRAAQKSKSQRRRLAGCARL